MFFKFLDAGLLRLEFFHSDKVPEPESDETQQGGSVTTRGMNWGNESKDERTGKKVPKLEIDDQEDTSDEYNDRPDPLFVAKVKKLGNSERW